MQELEKQNYQAISEGNFQTEKNKGSYFLKTISLYFQIFGCLLALITIIVLKQVSPCVFTSIKNFYIEKINVPISQNFNIKKLMRNIKEKLFSKFHRKFILKNQDKEILKGDNSVLLTVPVSKPLNEGSVTSRFGIRKDPFTSENKQHSGLDIGANSGEIIHAILPGIVAKTEKSSSYGNYLKLDHGNNIESLYAHCDKILVSEGDFISRGQDLALVGSSGRATGNHLHLEILVNGVKQNPENFLKNAYA